jgi:hypothetical protein
LDALQLQNPVNRIDGGAACFEVDPDAIHQKVKAFPATARPRDADGH